MSSANVHTDNTNCTVFVGICCSQNRFRISQLAKLPHFSTRFDCQNKSSIVLSSKDSQTADHSFVAVGCVTHRQHDLLRLFPKLVNLCCCSHRPPKKPLQFFQTPTPTQSLSHSYLPTSHRLPSQPFGQKHWKELMPSMQVPPFLQGDDAQSLMSAGREETFNCLLFPLQNAKNFKRLPQKKVFISNVCSVFCYG